MRLGGTAAINQLVNGMYHKIWKDPQLKDHFIKSDKDTQKERMKRYLTYLTGGSSVWTGKSMADAHRGRGIRADHFDLTMKHIMTTLKDMKVD